MTDIDVLRVGYGIPLTSTLFIQGSLLDSYHRPDPVLYDISPDTGSIDGYNETKGVIGFRYTPITFDSDGCWLQLCGVLPTSVFIKLVNEVLFPFTYMYLDKQGMSFRRE